MPDPGPWPPKRTGLRTPNEWSCGRSVVYAKAPLSRGSLNCHAVAVRGVSKHALSLNSQTLLRGLQNRSEPHPAGGLRKVKVSFYRIDYGKPPCRFRPNSAVGCEAEWLVSWFRLQEAEQTSVSLSSTAAFRSLPL